jgi:hypothetical protein
MRLQIALSLASRNDNGDYTLSVSTMFARVDACPDGPTAAHMAQPVWTTAMPQRADLSAPAVGTEIEESRPD